MLIQLYNQLYEWIYPPSNKPKNEPVVKNLELEKETSNKLNLNDYNDVFIEPVQTEIPKIKSNLSPIPEENEDLKFYYLALKRNNPEEKWTIHGLWPQTNLESYPVFCRKVTFDIKKLSPIIDKLYIDWHSDQTSNDYFWSHEWEKHGSCMFTEMDELEYFTKALDLYDFVIDNELIEEYINDENQKNCQIPFTINFELIEYY
tara:strand:+ start:59 stop:667 length:609 start_codon:yes stop_codon:yes gene_type:complete